MAGADSEQPDRHGQADGHGHAHGHDHHHAHGVSRDADKRYLATALLLLLLFMAGEVVVGLIASSLALISDAGHMLTDAGAIGMSLIAMRLADKPPRGSLTFGLKRAEILSAHINGITLVALAGWFLIEGVQRLIHPPEVHGGLVLWTALAGIVVNLLATWALSKANRQSLNVEGSFQHILTDLYAFIATAAAGGVMLWTGLYRADALVALLVAWLMLRAGVSLLKESGRVFLEAAPSNVDPAAISEALAGEDQVQAVRDLHVWEVTSEFPALSAHVLVGEAGDCRGECHTVRSRLEHLLHDRFGIEHVTLQIDHGPEDNGGSSCGLSAAG